MQHERDKQNSLDLIDAAMVRVVRKQWQQGNVVRVGEEFEIQPTVNTKVKWPVQKVHTDRAHQELMAGRKA